MKTKLRIVELENGQYEIQAKWRTWYDFIWGRVLGYDRIATEAQARLYLAGLTDQWRTRIVAVIEERTI